MQEADINISKKKKKIYFKESMNDTQQKIKSEEEKIK